MIILRHPLLSTTAARRLHILLNYLMWQISLFLKLFYLTVIMFCIVSYQKNKTSVYNLRTRAHNLTLTRKSCYYDNCNFITRMLFKGTLIHSPFYLFLQCVLSLFKIKEHDDDDEWTALRPIIITHLGGVSTYPYYTFT